MSAAGYDPAGVTSARVWSAAGGDGEGDAGGGGGGVGDAGSGVGVAAVVRGVVTTGDGEAVNADGDVDGVGETWADDGARGDGRPDPVAAAVAVAARGADVAVGCAAGVAASQPESSDAAAAITAAARRERRRVRAC